MKKVKILYVLRFKERYCDDHFDTSIISEHIYPNFDSFEEVTDEEYSDLCQYVNRWESDMILLLEPEKGTIDDLKVKAKKYCDKVKEDARIAKEKYEKQLEARKKKDIEAEKTKAERAIKKAEAKLAQLKAESK